MTESQKAAREELNAARAEAKSVASAIQGARGEKARRVLAGLAATHTDRIFALANEWNLAAIEQGQAEELRAFAARWSAEN